MQKTYYSLSPIGFLRSPLKDRGAAPNQGREGAPDAWPDGLDLARLPLPDYRGGDRVQFVRDETCAREGVVRMVLLRGGTYRPLDQVEVLIEQWYCQPESLRYIVTARGHDHTIRPGTILGRFVSRNRWER